MNTNWTKIPSDQIIQQTIDALEKNGITAEVVNTGQEAKEKALSLLPENAEVFTKTSETTHAIGLSEEIDNSGKYNSVRKQLVQMDRATQGRAMRKLGAAPDYLVGSVHAVTKEGHIFIASNTGSQLAADVYGGGYVIWVVGAQKIVKDDEEALKRIHEHSLPMESARFRKAYNMPDTWNSFVSKVLCINKEVNPQRIHLIFVKEILGF